MTRFLVVCDVDSTLIENEVIDLLANLAGRGDEVAKITAEAMAGDLDFESSLRRRVATLSGLRASAIEEVRSQLVVTTGAIELSQAAHSLGGKVCAVSGGFAAVLGQLAVTLELDGIVANTLGTEAQQLTGEVLGQVIGPIQKRQALERWAAEFDLPRNRVIAVGDGANDVEMLRAAGLSVAFDAKPVVREKASLSLPTRNLAELIPLLPRLQ